MNCARVSRLLSSYIDGELSGSEMLQVREHLDGCECCTEEIEGLRMVKRFTSGMRPASPAPHLETAILLSLQTVSIPAHVRLVSRIRAWATHKFEPATVAIAGCAVLLMAVLGHFPRSEPSFVRAVPSGGVAIPVGLAATDSSPAYATAALSDYVAANMRMTSPTMASPQPVNNDLSGWSNLPETRHLNLSNIGFTGGYSLLTNR